MASFRKVNRIVKKRRVPRRRARVVRASLANRRVIRPTRSLLFKANSQHYFTRWTDLYDVYVLQGDSFNPVSSGYGLHAIVDNTGGGTATLGYNTSTYLSLNVPGGSTSWYSFAIAGMFRAVTEYQEFALLFDKYRINGWSIKIVPTVNTFLAPFLTTTGSGNETSGSVGMPVIHSVIDRDDNIPVAASAAGVNLLRQYIGYKVNRFSSGNSFFKRYVGSPNVNLVGEANNGTSAIGVSRRSPWIDAATTNVEHYGMKFIIECNNQYTVDQQLAFKVEMKYYLQFKNPH